MLTRAIHVALASDDRYFEGLLTTAWSIARNCSRPGDLIFHVLNGGISPEHLDYLIKRLMPFKCKIDILVVDDSKSFSTFQTYHGNGRMTYARLLLPDLLPDVSHVIYSDVDILWVIDIAELWDSLDSNAVIHCTPSRNAPRPEVEWCTRYGFNFEFGKRFCAGMVVFNLDKFRGEKLHLKMLSALEACDGKAPCNDETVLNALVFGRQDRAFLSSRWQHMSGGQIKALEENGCVIHYLIDAPWQSARKHHRLITDAHILWHHFHAEARGISAWQSMKMANTVFDIIFWRTMGWSAHHFGLARALLRTLLILRGRRVGIPALNLYMMPFNTSLINKRLIPKTFRS